MKSTESLQDYAFEEIKKRIQNGNYAPGVKLNTQEISDSLGISRSPVVAAINRLVSLGLAESTPRKGTTVTMLSNAQIRNIIEARQMMELFCVKLCIRNADYYPSIIKKMEDIVQKFDIVLAADYPTAADLEIKFHSLYISLCDNPQIMKLYEYNWSVGTMFYMYSASSLPFERLEDSFHQHEQILEALKQKNEAMLYDTVEKHMSNVYESLEYYTQATRR